MMKFLSRFSRLGEAGDTIVEVMISVAILSLALAAAYSLGSAALRNGVSANQRTEALALAQGEVELLVNAKNNDSNFASKYQTSSPFCINTDGSRNTSVGSDNLCDGYNSTNYNVGVSYNSDTFVYTITAQWDNPNGINGKSQLNLYYKLPSTYNQAIVTTGSVSNLTTTSATLNGTVNPNGVKLSDCYFKYGPTTSYGSKVSCSSLPTGTSGSYPVSADVSGLTPSTQYHFVLCASNRVLGTSCGYDVTFTTADKPATTTNAASSVGSTSATLNGTVSPNGSALTDCYFDLGTTTSYGTKVSCSSTPSGTAGSSPVSGSISSLSSSTTYHFRFCATNVAGTNCGTDAVFATSAPPNPTVSFYASPQSISYNSSSTLYWSTTNTTNCYGFGGWSGWVGASGARSTGNLTSSTTYTITCYGASGSTPASKSTTVSVGSPPPPPPPSCSAWANTTGSPGAYYLSAGGGGCQYYYDTVVGWNGSFSNWGPTSQSCHTESAGADPWGWLASASAGC